MLDLGAIAAELDLPSSPATDELAPVPSTATGDAAARGHGGGGDAAQPSGRAPALRGSF